MVPSRRLLALFLLGVVPVVAAASNDRLWLLVFGYLAFLGGVLYFDWRITPKPQQLEVARINEPKLSLGAQNKITIALHNDSSCRRGSD